MQKIITVLALSLAIHAGPALAQAADPASAWPDPQCRQPDLNDIKPPASNNDAPAVSIYNAKVKSFNREALAYNSCIRAYVEAANQELKRVHDQADADEKRIAEAANAVLKMIQDKSQKALAQANAISAAQENGTAALNKGTNTPGADRSIQDRRQPGAFGLIV